MITVCSFIKLENDYIDEWLSYHISIGVDKFIIVDNNDGREDYPMTDYAITEANRKKVRFINKRNLKLDKNREMVEMYQMCSEGWVVFLDIDEFIELNGFSSINEWLSQQKFRDAANVRTDVISYGDNDIVQCNGNHMVRSRFTKISRKSSKFNNEVKAFIRAGIPNIKTLDDRGIRARGTKTVGVNGEEQPVNCVNYDFEDLSEVYIAAYPTKSLEEFCMTKIGRNKNFDEAMVDKYKEDYFAVNKKTKEKEEMFTYYINKRYFKDEKHYGMHSYANVYFGNGKSSDA